jgi:hypothetical protein
MKRKSIFLARTVMLLSQLYYVFVLSKTNPVIVYENKRTDVSLFGSLDIHFNGVWC